MESQLAAERPHAPGILDEDSTPAAECDIYGEDSATEGQIVTPTLRVVTCGLELLHNPRFNKGTAFTEDERDRHYLRGLLPPRFVSQDVQLDRLMNNIRSIKDPLEKYVAIMDTQERNERLFYRALLENVEELMPIVYTPTVGRACQKYGAIFHRPRGLYISIKDKGRVLDVLRNWQEPNVGVIVVTDGERILGLGDLGVNGMGIPVGKLALYTALGGVRPSGCLPITLDVGTNNKDLLKDEFYLGLPQTRLTGKEYDEFIEEFMAGVKQCFGEKVLVQFEDFGNENAFRILARYNNTHLVVNDDIQGTAAVALAGILAALPLTGGKLRDHTFVFLGAGEAGTGIAEITATYISRQEKISVEEAREKMWLVDSHGLVVKSRWDSLTTSKKPYAKEHKEIADLLSVVKAVKPTALIGTTATPDTFTKEVVEEMCKHSERPIVFALSNPTSKCECTAEQAYKWTNGKAIYAAGSPFDPVEINGQKKVTGQANNAYIYPGMGLGVMICEAIRAHDDMHLAAAVAIAEAVTEEDLKVGLVYPPFSKIRDVSARLAAKVAEKAYELGLATRQPRPRNLYEYAKQSMYSPVYRPYR